MRQVQDRFRCNDTAPHLAKSELESLHDKFDKVAGYLSRLTQSPAVAVLPVVSGVEPAEEMGTRERSQLTVIKGGLDGEGCSVRVNGDDAEATLIVAEAAV
jgi:hypothetical protein